MSKKLPKVIGRTMDDMRQTTVDGGAMDARAPPSTPPHRTAVPEARETNPARGPLGATAEAAATSIPAAERGSESVAKPAGADAKLRRARARAIVERHATYSAVGGLIPLPILDVAGITAIILRMVKHLSRHYHVPFDRHRARTVVIAMMGGAAPSGLATLVTSTITLGVPGINILGLAVSSVTAAACTRSIGEIFVERFESGETSLDMRAPGR